jgi:uncharacterized protein YndB with AHSA1/START domain
MSNYDWSKFQTRISVNVSIQEIYSAWATRSGLERWFLRTAEFTTPGGAVREGAVAIQKGDTYRWLWFGYDDSVVERGTILEANGKDFLQFTFAGKCLVSMRVKIEEGETVAELQQENIPLDETARVNFHLGCLTGWTFYMANLKSVLEGGLDLRNKNEKLRKVINA